MKRSNQALLWFGLAVGIFAWTWQEFYLLMLAEMQVGSTVRAVVGGASVGGLLGMLLGLAEGYFHDNPYKLKRGLKYGGVLGCVGGMVGFYMVENIFDAAAFADASPFMSNLFYAQRWLVLSLFLGSAFGFREKNNLAFIRGLMAGLSAGLAGGLVMGLCLTFVPSVFWARGLGLVIYALVFMACLHYVSFYKRQEWLRALNGKLEGLEYELTQNIHYLGTQSDDDINLSSYHDINSTHAKLIKFFTGYSLVDNDPFGRTFVNFRNITEQPLKNGDVIKIGTAMFQYCKI